MAAITVRRLDESVVQRLKARAKINGRSLEGEVRQILGAAVDDDMEVRKRVFRARCLPCSYRAVAEGSYAEGSAYPERSSDSRGPRSQPRQMTMRIVVDASVAPSG